MAIAVTQAYKDVQAQRGGKRARTVVQYKRRYFDPVLVAFAYEPNWHVLAQRDFEDPGEAVNQLDVAEPNIFKSTTVTLRLNNTDNRWVRSINDPSVFAADALAPNGYYDDQTIFQILSGFRKPDGTWEDCPEFTGFVFDNTPLPQMGYAELQVSASLLAEQCAAIRVNTPVTGEAMALSVTDEPLNPSPGDGTTAVLKTTSTGIISVANVKANGVALTLTTDYSVSIPTDGTAATITLVSPSAQNGKALTWSGVTQNLLTASSAVTFVSNLYADGTPLTQGDDYTVTIPTNVVGQTQVALVEPEIWIGKTFTWDGSKGALNKTIEEAVAMYCDAAGIGPSARNIQTVIFPGGLSASKTIDTEADWEAGTLLQNVTTTDTPGSLLQKWFLLDDFSDLDYTANPTWAQVIKTASTATISAATGKLVISASNAGKFAYATPMAKATGTWSADIIHSGVPGAAGSGEWNFFCVDNVQTGTGTGLIIKGYSLIWEDFTSQVVLRRCDVDAQTALILHLGTYDTSSHNWRVTRDATGLMHVYQDGVLVGSVTDNTYTTCAYMATNIVEASGTVTQSITNIYWTPDIDGTGTINALAIAEYQFNLLLTPAALGRLDTFDAVGTGAITYKTACAPDVAGVPGTYDALQVLGAGNQMTSTARQWLKLRIEFAPAAGSFSSPEVQKLVAHFIQSSVTLSQVAPTSGTAWDRIQVYAKMCNYETGWDATGTFFFRSRTVSTDAIIALTPWSNVIDVDDTHPGWDRVFNIGHASQTPYEYYYDKSSSGEAEPTSERRFGAIQRDLDFSSELVANDALIGLAAAQTAYLDNYLPKWRCRAQVKLASWLELSDPVALTFATDPKMLESIAGDPLQSSGFAGPAGVALAINKKMKIVGITKKIKARTADLLLEEILS